MAYQHGKMSFRYLPACMKIRMREPGESGGRNVDPRNRPTNKERLMYRRHVAPQTQNERTSSLTRGAKRRAGVKIAAFGVSALVAGQLLLPGVALATEITEPTAGEDIAVTNIVDPTKLAAETIAVAPNAAAPTAMEAEPAAAVAPANKPTAAPAPTSKPTATASAAAAATRGTTIPGGEIRIDSTVVNHFYDLELPPAFTLIQDEAFVYDFPDAPEGFTPWRNESIHLFRIDPDTESLVKTDNVKEANVSISLAPVDNHERATLVFTGGGADPLISYSLDLFHLIYIGALADVDFSNYNNGEGTILETRHEYYIRCVFGSNVHLIGTDTADPEPSPDVKPDPEIKPNPEVKSDPEVKPDPETKPDPAPQPETEKPAANPAPAKAAPVAKPAETTLPATGDNGAMAVALGAAGATTAAAAAGIAATRRRNR